MSQVYFEDVEPGYEVGPVVKMPTREQLDAFTTVWGSQTGRFTSDEAAQKEGFSGVILPGNMSMALLAQVLTEWAGSAGKLKRLEATSGGTCSPGTPSTASALSRTRGRRTTRIE